MMSDLDARDHFRFSAIEEVRTMAEATTTPTLIFAGPLPRKSFGQSLREVTSTPLIMANPAWPQ